MKRDLKQAKKKAARYLKKKIENCWAWTDDEKWEEKVKQEVRDYASGKR